MNQGAKAISGCAQSNDFYLETGIEVQSPSKGASAQNLSESCSASNFSHITK